LARESGLKPEEIGRCYRLIVDRMKITPPAPNGALYVEKVATKVGLSEETKKLSLMLVKMALDSGLEDRNPMVLAAAAIYTACLMEGEGKTQSEVAEAAGITEARLRSCARLTCRLAKRG
jgi:transcription initiation factor TFIIB